MEIKHFNEKLLLQRSCLWYNFIIITTPSMMNRGWIGRARSSGDGQHNRFCWYGSGISKKNSQQTIFDISNVGYQHSWPLSDVIFDNSILRKHHLNKDVLSPPWSVQNLGSCLFNQIPEALCIVRLPRSISKHPWDVVSKLAIYKQCYHLWQYHILTIKITMMIMIILMIL